MGCKDKLYAIREVSELTGIKPVTLRAWQRRYNIIKPHRTEKGHRLYTAEHIEQIKVIQGWLAKGVAIGKVKVLLENNTQTTDFEVEGQDTLVESEALLAALADLNQAKAESILGQVCKDYPLPIVHARLVIPVFEAIEQVKRSQQSLQYGLFLSLLMHKLSTILQAENKVARRGKCLLLSFDALGSIEMRFWALELAEQGYNISLVESVDDVSALIEADCGSSIPSLAIFASQSPTQVQITSIKEMSANWGDRLHLSPLISALVEM
ncbi:MerR family transcriptional regulator [Vibrio taketomensis]|uniref:MerR family transcriptional regulator n=1 Tax=Vibrio taketomensis TaxID=2572923 RepID=UPI001389AF34|nr:MerR family transcriptional regulator [Vibrio taketomensis]